MALEKRIPSVVVVEGRNVADAAEIRKVLRTADLECLLEWVEAEDWGT